jgi:amino acid adenylation domain-containing protein
MGKYAIVQQHDQQHISAGSGEGSGYVPARVEAQANIAPNAVAIAERSVVLTYRDLNIRASQLAKHLRLLGVTREVIVGLCLQRSPEMVTAALAVLKAAGAYLPIDPGCPINRLSFQLNNAQAPVVITDMARAATLPAGRQRIVTFESEGWQTSPDDCNFQVSQAREDDLAYVIYTSGSTGEPKGVEVSHRNLRNLIEWHQQTFNILPSDRVTFQSSPGFDAAVWELWPYLTAGASVHVMDDSTRATAIAFRDFLIANAITIAFAPTPMAEQLIQLSWPRNTQLRILLTGGDTLRRRPPKGLPFELVNNYGPTECTVVATSTTVSPAGSHELPAIGRPIANVQIYVVDDSDRRVAPGTSGELYIGGAAVARGYCRRPDLTATRFVPDPFGAEPGARLYRTGDLGCQLPDGQIAFLGRSDDQVKLRGFRIELDEIISVLNRHPLVHDSMVVARNDTPDEKHLVAYVVAEPEADVTDKSLRDYLALHLPDFMVPTHFVALRSFPLSSSGKIDRKALPTPTEANILRQDAYVPPRTSVEERIAAMLADLLHIERVGVTDNFFFLGVNSLLGAQVTARLYDIWGIDVSLFNLFNHPTVAELSSEVERLLVTKLENMSDDEAGALITSSQPPVTFFDER